MKCMFSYCWSIYLNYSYQQVLFQNIAIELFDHDRPAWTFASTTFIFWIKIGPRNFASLILSNSFTNTIQKKNHVNSCASKFLLVYGMSKKLMFIIWKWYFMHKKITNVLCFWCKMTHYLQYETLMETLFCSTIVADSTVQNLLFVI